MDRTLAHASHVELAPMRIGEILDKSVSVFRRVFPKAFVPFAVLAVFQTIQQAHQQQGIGLLAALPAAILSIVIYFSSVFLASDHWLGQDCSWKEAYRRVRFRFLLRALLISLIVMLVLVVPFIILIAGSVAFGAAAKSVTDSPGVMIPLFLIGAALTIALSIASVVYFTNRILAYYIAILEDQGAFDALNRSKFLMSQGAWYSLKSPWMRVFGLFVVTTIVSLAVGIVTFAAQASQLMGLHAALNYSFLFMASMLSNAVYVFSTITMTGFYYDLRVRYEAFGLGTAPAASQPAASSAAYMWLERNKTTPTQHG